MNFYNDNDSYVAKWLGNLVTSGHLPQGTVDARSIVDIEPTELRPFRQCHFFAGIGGWPYALQLVGWPPARSIWTGSCPCQPFSAAGARKAGSDKRHLWPEWLRLIRECRPNTIISEQVEGAVGLGWLDRVFSDLEAEGYACGAAVLGAHSVGAPHIRQRLFWVADASEQRRQQIGRGASGDEGADGRQPNGDHVASGGGAAGGGVADSAISGRCEQPRWDGGEDWRSSSESGRLCDAGGVGLPIGSGFQEQRRIGSVSRQTSGPSARQATIGTDAWADVIWLPCLDGKARRIESSIQPLAYGLSVAVDNLGTISRVGALRGAGNAIVPQVAAEFVRAFMETGEI